MLLGGTALTLGLGLAISFLLARDLSTVAGRLETAAERIASGDLAYRIGLRRRDEFGITARAFDQMALRLSTADHEREQANAGLRAANAELEQFAYTVSHDLKAPLVTIQGFAHRLTKDYSERLDDAGRRYLSRIEASATHLGVLIEDVLAFSRVGRIGAPPVAVDLEAALRRALEGLQEEAEARGARVDVLSPLPVVVASPTLVGQIVGNLLANALTYGAPKGEAPQIDVSCDDLGESWRLRVRDHGPGIPADQRDRLFRLFERLPAGKAANPSGTGVGLATVRKAAQAMGGTAGVETPDDGGASFWVAFPKVPPGAISGGHGPGALEIPPRRTGTQRSPRWFAPDALLTRCRPRPGRRAGAASGHPDRHPSRLDEPSAPAVDERIRKRRAHPAGRRQRRPRAHNGAGHPGCAAGIGRAAPRRYGVRR